LAAEVELEETAGGRLQRARGLIATHPEEALAWTVLGEALEELSPPPDDAAALLRKGLEVAPRVAVLWRGKARVDARAGRLQEALAASDRSVALAPRDLQAVYLRAQLLAFSGRCAEAARERELARAIASETGGGKAAASLPPLAPCQPRG
ncbi:MAG TPA: hypothetical protein VND93_28040, partial [Myxococcales bacterium]|nr:hypothetical protein [Myxococcales bacterium]